MTPELPIALPPGTTFIEVVVPLECAMLRCGLPCSNDAQFVLTTPADYAGRHQLIPVCDMCIEDASAAYSGWSQALECVLSPSFADWTQSQ